MPQQRTITLPILTSAETTPLLVVGMGGSPRLREGKVTPTGEVTYASNCVPLIERDGELLPQKNWSVHVLKPAATYELGTVYTAFGRLWVQPWAQASIGRNGAPDARVMLSVTVEELRPVRPSSQREAG